MTGLISYLVFFSTVAAILSIAVLGLNLQWGNSGLFNGGVVAFFGAGAYGTLILGGTPQSAHLGGYELFYPLALLGGMAAAGLMATQGYALFAWGAEFFIRVHDFLAGSDQFVTFIRDRQAIDFGGVEKALHVVR